MGRIWALLKDTGEGFIADDALTRAAGIAYFTLFSIGPLLFIATGIASFVFGRDQVDDAISAQMTGMLGDQAAREVGRLAEGAMGHARGGWFEEQVEEQAHIGTVAATVAELIR